MHLADLGADVIKVEVARRRLHPRDDLADHRGRVAAAPARQPRQEERRPRPAQADEGVQVYLELRARRPTSSSRPCAPARSPGAASATRSCRRGQPEDRVLQPSPGYGMTGPYKDLPGHGIAFDTWAGSSARPTTKRASATSPSTPRSACTPARCFGALGILAGVIRARDTGQGCRWRSRSPTPRRTWTGTASRPGRPTNGPSTRSPATSPTTTSAARPARPA